MIDFLIMYELKNREIENVVLIGEELKRRGYKVRYVSRFNFHDFASSRAIARKTKRRFNNKVNVLLTVGFYKNSEVANMVFPVVGKPKKIVNLRWEQILSTAVEKNYGNFEYPHDLAKRAIHVSWGQKITEDMVESGIRPKNLITTGPIQMDFLRAEFQGYYLNKEELLDKYGIESTKKTILFISSFVYSNFSEREISEYENSIGVELKDTYEASVNSFESIANWIERFIKNNEYVNFIYRPHPEEIKNKRLLDLKRKYKNFYLISEYSVKQWILASDVVTTWISTSIAEAYFANKPCLILRPVQLPLSLEMVIYNGAKTINTFEDFQNAIQDETAISIRPDVIEGYYDINKETPSFIRFCNALEDIINDEAYNFKWDDRSIKYVKILNLKRALYYDRKTDLYHFFLRVLSLVKRMTNINFGKDINERISQYENFLAKVAANRVSNEEIRQLSKKMKTYIEKFH